MVGELKEGPQHSAAISSDWTTLACVFQSFILHLNYFKPGNKFRQKHLLWKPLKVFWSLRNLGGGPKCQLELKPKVPGQKLNKVSTGIIGHDFQWQSDPKLNNGNLITDHSHLYVVFQWTNKCFYNIIFDSHNNLEIKTRVELLPPFYEWGNWLSES